VSPADGAVGVGASAKGSAVLSEPVDPASVAGGFELRGPGGALVAAVVSSSGATVTLDPSQPLASLTSYTATLKGGSGGITDGAGNPLAGDRSWTFTTVTAGAFPCSLWCTSTVRTIPAESDGTDFE